MIKEITILQGHTNSVTCLALDKVNNRLYSGSDDKTIKVWNLETGKEITSLQGHTSSVRCLALDRVNNRLYSGSGDKTIKVWNLPSFSITQLLFLLALEEIQSEEELAILENHSIIATFNEFMQEKIKLEIAKKSNRKLEVRQ